MLAFILEIKLSIKSFFERNAKLDLIALSIEPNIVSVGSAYFEPGYQDILDAIKSADENLYLQKSKLKSERESKT